MEGAGAATEASRQNFLLPETSGIEMSCKVPALTVLVVYAAALVYAQDTAARRNSSSNVSLSTAGRQNQPAAGCSGDHREGPRQGHFQLVASQRRTRSWCSMANRLSARFEERQAAGGERTEEAGGRVREGNPQ